MKKLLMIPVMLLTLPAAMCETRQPGVEVRTIEVPVPVPCLAEDQIPVEPARVGEQLTGDPRIDLPIVSSSALALRAWGQVMHSALTACADAR